MRLYAHNLLACLKCEAFPLEVGPGCKIAPTSDDYDEDFTRRMLVRLDYPILVAAFSALQEQHPQVLGEEHSIPASLSQLDPSNTAHLKAVYYAISGIAIREGCLVCAECQSVYKIVDYIPVMLPEKK